MNTVYFKLMTESIGKRSFPITHIAALILLLSGLSSCDVGEDYDSGAIVIERVDRIPQESLRRRIIQYYTAEKAENWQTSYQLRHAAFRELVPFEAYEREMRRGMSGWSLIKVKILGSQESDDGTITVGMRFFEKAIGPREYDSYIREGAILKTEQATIWTEEDGQWFSIAAGTRWHLMLNTTMVHD